MKKQFRVLKNRPRISIKLRRDSVCAADDCDAPHEKIIKLYSFTDPEILATETASSYLPSINGIGHSWICKLNGSEIARISNDGVQTKIRTVEYQEENEIYFSYISSRY